MRREVFKKVIKEVTQRLNGYDDFIHKGHPQGIIPVETEATLDNIREIHSIYEVFCVAALNLGCGEFSPKFCYTDLDITDKESGEIYNAFQSVYNKFRGISEDADGNIVIKDIDELEDVSIKDVVSALKETLPVDKKLTKLKDDIKANTLFDKPLLKEIIAGKFHLIDTSIPETIHFNNLLKVSSSDIDYFKLNKKQIKVLDKAAKKTEKKIFKLYPDGISEENPLDLDLVKKVYKKQLKKAINKALEKEASKELVKQDEVER